MRLLEADSPGAAPTADLDSTLDDAVFEPSVKSYCTANELDTAMRTAVALAREHFAGDKIQLAVQVDPESADEWLEVLISTGLRPRELNDRFETLLRAFNQATPYPQKANLRFSFAFCP